MVFLLQSGLPRKLNTLAGVKQARHGHKGTSTQFSLLRDLFHFERDEQDMTLTLPSPLDCM